MRRLLADDMDKARIETFLAKTLPHGSNIPGLVPIVGAREVFVNTVGALSYVLNRNGSGILLELETVKPKSGVVGIIVFDSTTASTFTIPVTISPSLVRLRKQPVFLAHEKAATNLLDLILIEIESVLEADHVVRPSTKNTKVRISPRAS